MSTVKLNKNQMNAVDHYKGPMMVLAGPGSGKTTVITYRIKTLIEKYNIPEKDILVITFTKSASEEMQNRFLNVTEKKYNNVTFGTFHSFFFRILRGYYNYSLENIIHEGVRLEVIRGIIQKEKIEVEQEEDFLNSLSLEISLIKNQLIDVKYHNPLSLGKDEFASIYNGYELYKKENNKIDFDDMLIKCYELILNNPVVLKFWQDRYKYILIDEFQDINKVQYECIKLLAAPLYNIFIVGDDDQSIYKFRGAKPEFLLRFPNEYSHVESAILDTNYRSTDQIIKICNKIINQNKVRFEKKIIGTNVNGEVASLIKPEDISAEASMVAKKVKGLMGKIPLHEIAIIYRTNIQARAFVDVFMDMNIPYQVRDEMPVIYEHWISKDICAYMKLALDKTDDDSLIRIINRPKRYMSKAIIASCKKQSGSLLKNLHNANNIQMWQLIRIEELDFYLNSIKLRKTYDAFKYIRQAVCYDDYIKEYANYRKMNSSGLFEVLDELQEAAKSYEKIEDYLIHVENVIEESKNKNIEKKHDKNAKKDSVILTTMHSAKGLEFHTVFLVGVVEGVIPHEKSKTIEEIEEECRLLYVGMTRAKKKLYISILKNRYEQEAKPSRFLDKLIKE